MKMLALSLFLLSSLLLPARADDLAQYGKDVARFHLAPSRAHYNRLQSEADHLASALQKKGNHADLLTAVFIARASEFHHWPITGRSAIANLAREIVASKTSLAKYVDNDASIDVEKLDVWWADFLATGQTKYLSKILNRARYPRPGERAADFMVPAMAAWSFKSNCHQDPMVMAFAKECLAKNSFPQKTAFLKECTAFGGEGSPSPVSDTTQPAPRSMSKIVTRRLGQKAGSFAAQPTTAYFAGTKYGRLEESTDTANGIHGLMITNEPDVWMINRANNTGRHIVDPGPTFDLHAPIFWQAKEKGQSDPEKAFKDLEFGHETQFFRTHHAHSAGTREVDGKTYEALSLKSGAIEVTLLLDPKSGKPFEIDETHNHKPTMSIRYLSYETNLPFRKSLFEPPKSVTMTEAP